MRHGSRSLQRYRTGDLVRRSLRSHLIRKWFRRQLSTHVGRHKRWEVLCKLWRQTCDNYAWRGWLRELTRFRTSCATDIGRPQVVRHLNRGGFSSLCGKDWNGSPSIVALNLPISHQAGTWIATLFAQMTELIAWSKLHTRSQPTRVRLATLLRFKFRETISVRKATRLNDRIGSSARMVLLALLGAKLYEDSGGALALQPRNGRLLEQ